MSEHVHDFERVYECDHGPFFDLSMPWFHVEGRCRCSYRCRLCFEPGYPISDEALDLPRSSYA